MVSFDTNILFYAADRRDARKRATAQRIMREHSTDAVMLWQVACEFIAAARKLEPGGFSKREAWDQLIQYLATFGLMLPSVAVLDRARVLHAEQEWSFWDAMIVAACVEAGITRLYSEDLPGRTPPAGFEIVNPFT